MPKPILWSSLSETDFNLILDCLQTNWNEEVVEDFIQITEGIINQISINPSQFPVINKRKKVRKCVITKHNTLFYRDRKNFVDILRIYNTRQDPHKLKF